MAQLNGVMNSSQWKLLLGLIGATPHCRYTLISINPWLSCSNSRDNRYADSSRRLDVPVPLLFFVLQRHVLVMVSTIIQGCQSRSSCHGSWSNTSSAPHSTIWVRRAGHTTPEPATKLGQQFEHLELSHCRHNPHDPASPEPTPVVNGIRGGVFLHCVDFALYMCFFCWVRGITRVCGTQQNVLLCSTQPPRKGIQGRSCLKPGFHSGTSCEIMPIPQVWWASVRQELSYRVRYFDYKALKFANVWCVHNHTQEQAKADVDPPIDPVSALELP